MHIGRVLIQIPFVLTRDREVVIRLGRGSHIDRTKTRRFFNGLLGPDARVDVIGLAIFRQQVQRDLSKLLTCAALQKQNLVVRGDRQQVTQVLLSLGGNGHELIAAMAHFHDRQAFAMPVEQLGLGTQQDSFRKRSWTCAEVIGSFAHIHSRSDLVGHAINRFSALRLNARPRPRGCRFFIRDKQQGGEFSSAPCVSAYSCGASSSAAASSGCSSSAPSRRTSPSISIPSSPSPSSSSPSTSEGS